MDVPYLPSRTFSKKPSVTIDSRSFSQTRSQTIHTMDPAVIHLARTALLPSAVFVASQGLHPSPVPLRSFARPSLTDGNPELPIVVETWSQIRLVPSCARPHPGVFGLSSPAMLCFQIRTRPTFPPSLSQRFSVYLCSASCRAHRIANQTTV
ncbi:hypothetical protein LY76DRAFT_173977 [Colletotrichum caudatum]|nr:hypothetical protein LY76DRAFT_173977 [Colletotrichum caudatum]